MSIGARGPSPRVHMLDLNLLFQTAEWETVVPSKRAMAVLRFFDFGMMRRTEFNFVASRRVKGREKGIDAKETA